MYSPLYLWLSYWNWKHHSILELEENNRVKCAAVNCRSGFSPTKKEKELMTKGITPLGKKHVFAFPKEEATRRLWLSAIHRYADSFNSEHSVVCEFPFKAEDFEANYTPRTITARVRVRLKPKALIAFCFCEISV